ncbi:NucA/NucB deoxyribonuclease domain-containing protein [Priestia sp. SB1]|uniref:NucA/NucB deoxyribonuclease domain-containing protein n=1 Tax=Priestia sp. SB1 TaxID=3132359 RepID=UPI003177D396
MKTKLLKAVAALAVPVVFSLSGCSASDFTTSPPQKTQDEPKQEQTSTSTEYDVKIDFPEDRYPLTAKHIKDAIADGQDKICTIDRAGADENRKLSLKGVPTKPGYDRDEWPMAMCEEGGQGADIEYIPPSDNRGAGSWVGNQLEQYEDGTKVYIEVQ